MKPLTVEEMKREIEELGMREDYLIARLPPFQALVCRLRRAKDGFLGWLDRNVLIVPVGIFLFCQTVAEEIIRKKEKE